MAELFDLYDENRRPLGKTHIKGEPIPDGAYHIIARVWVVCPDGRILLTRRSMDKPGGGLWEFTAGSVVAGEDSATGALRELDEEIGVEADKSELTLINTVRDHGAFWDTYIIKKNIAPDELKFQPGEVDGAKLVTMDELDALCRDGAMVFNHEHYALLRGDLARIIAGE